ncbi:MAG: hypothetical protein ACREOO_17800 [bacterium]
MKRFASILLSFTIAALSVNPVRAQSNAAAERAADDRAAAAFEQLKSLAGEWHGQGPHGLTRVSYQIVSGGMAVMETIIPPNEPTMVTLYHRDGDQLMMTHYCSGGNQPRMRAEAPAGEIKNLNFAFVDVTNLTKPTDGHMQKHALSFQDQDHITSVWTWRQDGKDTPSTFILARKK